MIRVQAKNPGGESRALKLRAKKSLLHIEKPKVHRTIELRLTKGKNLSPIHGISSSELLSHYNEMSAWLREFLKSRNNKTLVQSDMIILLEKLQKDKLPIIIDRDYDNRSDRIDLTKSLLMFNQSIMPCQIDLIELALTDSHYKFTFGSSIKRHGFRELTFGLQHAYMTFRRPIIGFWGKCSGHIYHEWNGRYWEEIPPNGDYRPAHIYYEKPGVEIRDIR